MTHLRQILPDRGLLLDMIDQKYIRKQEHSTEPLIIFNYTERAVFDRVWNDATRMCRGLIINSETYEVVARPFPKFFNWNEPSAPKIELDVPVWASDKMDGSLGIRYWAPRAKRWCIATRGSFTSEQAIHATERLNEYYEGIHEPPNHEDRCLTQLFEIVYPENRIVLDYGHRDELVALGIVDIQSGYVFPASEISDPDFPQASKMPAETFGDALKLEPRKNAEGIVVITKLDSCQVMVKIKQDDYVLLHRTITGLNDRVIWERMRAGETLDAIKFGIPEEFWDYIDQTYDGLLEEFCAIKRTAERTHRIIIGTLDTSRGPDRWDRKAYASHAVSFSYKDLLFQLLDGRDITDVIWKKLKPEAANGPMKRRTEDVA